MSNKIWEAVVEAVVRMQVEADKAEAKAKAEAMAVKAATNMVDALWEIELSKSEVDKLNDVMNATQWW